jgi:hypothetical protein
MNLLNPTDLAAIAQTAATAVDEHTTDESAALIGLLYAIAQSLATIAAKLDNVNDNLDAIAHNRN